MLRDWLSILAGTAVPKNQDFRGAFEEREREHVYTLNFKYHPLTRCSKRLVRSGKKRAQLAKPGPFCPTPSRACIARMFVWGLERGKCEGGLHGEFSACVFGWAQATTCCGNCVCAFDTVSKHPVTFLNRHVAAVRCCAGGTRELEAIAPKFC